MTWLTYAIMVVLVLAAIVVAGWFIIGDRPRGRRRCPKCWHSMEGLPEQGEGGWTCPECGRNVRGERDLFRTRRRPATRDSAVLLLFIGASIYGHGVHQRRAEGASAWVPSLLAVTLVTPPDGHVAEWRLNRFLRELIVARKGTRAMPAWQYRFLIWRFTNWSEEAAWANVHIRDRWVKGEPIPVCVGYKSVSGDLLYEQFTLSADCGAAIGPLPRIPGFDQHAGIGYMVLQSWTNIPSNNADLIASTGDEAVVELNIVVSMETLNRTPFAYSMTKRHSRVFRIELFDSPEQLLDTGVIVPHRDPEIDGMIHPNILYEIRTLYDDRIHLQERFMSRIDILLVEREWACALMYDVEVVCDGAVFSRWHSPNERPPFSVSELHAEAREGVESVDPLVRDAAIEKFNEWVRWHRHLKPNGVEPDMTGWSIRITPRPDRALRYPQYDRYWVPADGSDRLEFPLSEVPDITRTFLVGASTTAAELP